MYTGQMPTPREVLVAYSNQQASSEEVWRALVAHTGWYVPAAFAVGPLRSTSSDGATLFANEVQTADHALILFTDAVAAAHAEGAPIGIFMRQFSGIQIFQALGGPYGAVRVNPHSPKSESWYIGKDAFPLANLWAKVVHLEQSLANASTAAVPRAAIAAHPGFMVLVNSKHLPITLNLKQPEGSYAVAFTAPDRFQEFVARQPAEQHPNLKSATLDGATLCRRLGQFDVAGLVIYYQDGGGFVLPKEEFEPVLQAGAQGMGKGA
jgi:hypothetical protein